MSLAVGGFVKIEFDCFVFISNPNIIRNSRITYSYIVEHLQSFVIFAGSRASTEIFDSGAIEGDCWPRCRAGHEGLQQCHVGRCGKVAEPSAVLYVTIYEQRGVMNSMSASFVD